MRLEVKMRLKKSGIIELKEEKKDTYTECEKLGYKEMQESKNLKRMEGKQLAYGGWRKLK